MRWDSSPRRSYFWGAGLAAVEGGVPSRGPAHLNSQENEQIKKWALIKLKFFLFHYLFICGYIWTCLRRYVHMSWSEESSGFLGAGSRHLGGAQLALWVQNSSPCDCKVNCSYPLSLLHPSIWISFVLLLEIEPKASDMLSTLSYMLW